MSSHGEGRRTYMPLEWRFSDVDLLVVYAGSTRDDAYRLVRRTLDIPGLEPHIYTSEEAAQLRPMLDRMLRDGVEMVAPRAG